MLFWIETAWSSTARGPGTELGGTALSRATAPNELWCADYKGEFMLADRRYCYPLTITDFASRYLISCDALATIKEASGTLEFHNFLILNKLLK
jgi:hypothetical protein